MTAEQQAKVKATFEELVQDEQSKIAAARQSIAESQQVIRGAKKAIKKHVVNQARVLGENASAD